MQTSHAHQLLKTAKALRTNLLAVIDDVDRLSDLIEGLPGVAESPPPMVVVTASRTLRLDRRAYTVRWGEKSCALGCTMAFRVLEHLARRPNEYVTVDRLLDDLWSGPRTYSTVRSTVCRLKAKLGQSGLAELAERIDGSMNGHYGLMLQDG